MWQIPVRTQLRAPSPNFRTLHLAITSSQCELLSQHKTVFQCHSDSVLPYIPQRPHCAATNTYQSNGRKRNDAPKTSNLALHVPHHLLDVPNAVTQAAQHSLLASNFAPHRHRSNRTHTARTRPAPPPQPRTPTTNSYSCRNLVLPLLPRTPILPIYLALLLQPRTPTATSHSHGYLVGRLLQPRTPTTTQVHSRPSQRLTTKPNRSHPYSSSHRPF